MALLEMHDACTSPWGSELLRGLNLQLESGQILGVVGPNGAGKSSLINLIAGDLPLDSGALLFDGRTPQQWSVAARARRQAVLPQASLLNFPFSVEEVIRLGRIPHASGKASDERILHELLEAMDLIHLRSRLYTRLSGGEKQRVQLARVLAQVWEPPSDQRCLLLLDEPTTALDLAHQRLLMQTLRTLADNGCAILMVIHDFNLLARVADQILALKAGSIVAHGPVAEVLTTQVFQAVFDVDVKILSHPDSGLPVVISA